MKILVHLGLNKCASTYLQAALTARSPVLRRAGVFYPVEGEQICQYGLSRRYGFGPEAPGLVGRDLDFYIARAAERDCGRIILSSEYLSLRRPAAIARFAAAAEACGAELSYLFISRPVDPWVRSLFNQYVKTVDGGPYLGTIDGFVDRILGNGAADIAGRWGAWAEAVGEARMQHLHLTAETPKDRVLAPFAEFAGIAIPPAPEGDANASLSPKALFLTGLIRQAPPSKARDRLLAEVSEKRLDWLPLPSEYLEIGADRRQRLATEVAAPLSRLPGLSGVLPTGLALTTPKGGLTGPNTELLVAPRAAPEPGTAPMGEDEPKTADNPPSEPRACQVEDEAQSPPEPRAEQPTAPGQQSAQTITNPSEISEPDPNTSPEAIDAAPPQTRNGAAAPPSWRSNPTGNGPPIPNFFRAADQRDPSSSNEGRDRADTATGPQRQLEESSGLA